MSTSKKKVKKAKSSSRKNIYSSKHLQKIPDKIPQSFFDELQEELDEWEGRLFDGVGIEADEDTELMLEEIIEILSPKQLSDSLNLLGGEFTQSEAKTIKKFVKFMSNLEDNDEIEKPHDDFEIIAEFSKNIRDVKSGGKKKNKQTKKQTKVSTESSNKIEQGGEIYIIESKFGSATRVIGIRSDQTLQDLHFAIQKYFDWDDDHLYAFFMDNKPYSRSNYYNDPRGNEPPFANEITLKDLELRKNKKFLYLFDFGDDNLFQLTFLDRQLSSDFESKDFPLLISKKGKNPRQYSF